MNSPAVFRLGVIEGFFGRQWSWQARYDYADFLATIGCNSYVYAPKGDPWLRKYWDKPFPATLQQQLKSLCATYREQGLDFGIGLSPFELYRDFSGLRRSALKMKLEQINDIAPTTLCILFDDMVGDLHDLAPAQAQIMDFVCSVSTARNFVLCPTYYSDDPVLVYQFGERPDYYLEDLGRNLDQAIEIFWTGPKVFSATYPRDHLLTVAEKLRRKPVIWDNYPVNDAKRYAGFLHLSPFRQANSCLRELSNGHLSNPMNEAYLSQIPLWTLPRIYQSENMHRNLLHEACQALCPVELALQLVRDAECFQFRGLDQMDDHLKAQLVSSYSRFREHPVAREVISWLRGEYAFDPACLT